MERIASAAVTGQGRRDTAAAPGSERRAALWALLLGALLLFGTGFAGADLLHAAAHDTRHALAFPCH